jgi:hypothetical protein
MKSAEKFEQPRSLFHKPVPCPVCGARWDRIVLHSNTLGVTDPCGHFVNFEGPDVLTASPEPPAIYWRAP